MNTVVIAPESFVIEYGYNLNLDTSRVPVKGNLKRTVKVITGTGEIVLDFTWNHTGVISISPRAERWKLFYRRGIATLSGMEEEAAA